MSYKQQGAAQEPSVTRKGHRLQPGGLEGLIPGQMVGPEHNCRWSWVGGTSLSLLSLSSSTTTPTLRRGHWDSKLASQVSHFTQLGTLGLAPALSLPFSPGIPGPIAAGPAAPCSVATHPLLYVRVSSSRPRGTWRRSVPPSLPGYTQKCRMPEPGHNQGAQDPHDPASESTPLCHWRLQLPGRKTGDTGHCLRTLLLWPSS